LPDVSTATPEGVVKRAAGPVKSLVPELPELPARLKKKYGAWARLICVVSNNIAVITGRKGVQNGNESTVEFGFCINAGCKIVTLRSFVTRVFTLKTKLKLSFGYGMKPAQTPSCWQNY
jgi:hypothetical protein